MRPHPAETARPYEAIASCCLVSQRGKQLVGVRRQSECKGRMQATYHSNLLHIVIASRASCMSSGTLRVSRGTLHSLVEK